MLGTTKFLTERKLIGSKSRPAVDSQPQGGHSPSAAEPASGSDNFKAVGIRDIVPTDSINSHQPPGDDHRSRWNNTLGSPSQHRYDSGSHCPISQNGGLNGCLFLQLCVGAWMLKTASSLWAAGLLTAAGGLAIPLYSTKGLGQTQTAPEIHRESELDPPARDRLSIDQARDRARLLHDVSIAALESMHRTYFQREKSIIPSFVMEDVFGQVKRQWKVEAHWIAVNMKAMSVDHEPKTPFEKQAALEIAAGEVAYEEIENGIYRRAGAVPLGAACVNCHGGFFRDPGNSPKYAGLVITLRIADRSAE